MVCLFLIAASFTWKCFLMGFVVELSGILQHRTRPVVLCGLPSLHIHIHSTGQASCRELLLLWVGVIECGFMVSRGTAL